MDMLILVLKLPRPPYESSLKDSDLEKLFNLRVIVYYDEQINIKIRKEYSADISFQYPPSVGVLQTTL